MTYPIHPDIARAFPRLLSPWIDGAVLEENRYYVEKWVVKDGRLTIEYELTADGAMRVGMFGEQWYPPFC